MSAQPNCKRRTSHGDVARVCVDALTKSEKEVNVGGPDIFTRKEIAGLAFEVLGKKPKTIRIPAGIFRAFIFPVIFFDRRLYDLLDFGITVFTNDIIAPQVGHFHLSDYLKQLANKKRPQARA